MNQSGRIISIDVFRGLTIAAMILVNYPGAYGHSYAPLEHAHWAGVTPTDFIFPIFHFHYGHFHRAFVYQTDSKREA